MNRYKFIPRIDTTKQVQYYLSALPVTFSQEEVPFVYVARAGDRLDTIYNAFYKTPTLWWVIAQANKLANGSMAIEAGTALYIPNI